MWTPPKLPGLGLGWAAKRFKILQQGEEGIKECRDYAQQAGLASWQAVSQQQVPGQGGLELVDWSGGLCNYQWYHYPVVHRYRTAFLGIQSTEQAFTQSFR